MIPPLAITGLGAVSPAGWGLDALAARIASAEPIEPAPLAPPPGCGGPSHVGLQVPVRRDELSAHPRLRRAGKLAHFAAAAAVEALGPEKLAAVRAGGLRLGVIYCLLNGGVTYSRRFYGEVLDNPATASPILFPETVFNAPASHLAAFLGVTGPVNTLVGDATVFFAGVESAALWLELGLIDACLVVGAEECDWVSAAGLAALEPGSILAEGAGCLLVEAARPTDNCRVTPLAGGVSAGLPYLVDGAVAGRCPANAVFDQLGACAGTRVSPLVPLGHAPGAATAWQAVVAAMAVATGVTAAATVAACGSPGKLRLLAIHGNPGHC